MSFQKNLKLLAVSTLLVTAISCGKDSKKSNDSAQMDTVCDNASCMSVVTWKMYLQGQIFPAQARLEINGESVIDECVAKQQYSFDRDSAPQSITLENYMVPQGAVDVKIVDLGRSCLDKSDDVEVINQKDVKYEFSKDLAGNLLTINL